MLTFRALFELTLKITGEAKVRSKLIELIIRHRLIPTEIRWMKSAGGSVSAYISFGIPFLVSFYLSFYY